MSITFDLHTHTRESDGKSLLSENIDSARQLGIGLGTSDHGPGHPWFGIRKNRIDSQKQQIQAAQQHSTLPLLQGLEANLVSRDGGNDLQGVPPLDYVLLGHHKGTLPFSFFPTWLLILNRSNPQKARTVMTDASIAAMSDGRIDAITHPGAYVPVHMDALARAAAQQGVLIEINQRHPLPVQDARLARQAGATFLLSSDAHLCTRIGQVDQAWAVAREAGIAEEHIVNSPAYRWDREIRLHRLKERLCRAASLGR